MATRRTDVCLVDLQGPGHILLLCIKIGGHSLIAIAQPCDITTRRRSPRRGNLQASNESSFVSLSPTCLMLGNLDRPRDVVEGVGRNVGDRACEIPCSPDPPD